MNASVKDDVMDKIADEINDINVDGTVDYEPKAWTREGLVD